MRSLTIKIYVYLCVFVSLALMFAVPVFCEEKKTLQVAPEIVEKSMPYYKYSLRNLMTDAQKNIKKLDQELRAKEDAKLTENNEALSNKYYDRGVEFYENGNLREARKMWYKAYKITGDKKVQKSIQKVMKTSK